MQHHATRRPPYGGEQRPRFMDLSTATWMVRHLDQPVSMVHITPQRGVFAGGWDGQLVHWDDQGEQRWRAQTNDRISSIALSDDIVAVASGLHVVALDRTSGEERWSAALEGSADELVWWQGDLVAVSSVYDIEHNDFIESAVWRFSPNGELLWVERMDERPWTLVEVEGNLLAGLGRPDAATSMFHRSLRSTTPNLQRHRRPPAGLRVACRPCLDKPTAPW